MNFTPLISKVTSALLHHDCSLKTAYGPNQPGPAVKIEIVDPSGSYVIDFNVVLLDLGKSDSAAVSFE